jgi:membrane-associated protein
VIPTIPIREWIEWLGTFYDQYGYLLVFFSALSENTAITGLILPGNTLVLLGAFYARLGTLNLGLVILLATLGTIVGYHLDYLLGRFVLKRLAEPLHRSRIGKRLRLEGRVRLARRVLTKHGGKAILISHLTSTLRSAIAVSAGFIHMPYRTFLFFEVIAATIWNTAFALLGYFIAVQVDQLEVLIRRFGMVMFVVVVLVFLLWHFTRNRVRQRIRQARRARRMMPPKDLVAQ